MGQGEIREIGVRQIDVRHYSGKYWSGTKWSKWFTVQKHWNGTNRTDVAGTDGSETNWNRTNCCGIIYGEWMEVGQALLRQGAGRQLILDNSMETTEVRYFSESCVGQEKEVFLAQTLLCCL